MGAVAKFHGLRIFNVVSEDFFAARTDKGVAGRRIEHEDEVGEAVDEAAGKFLLLVEAALHLAALGDVHERALIAHHAAGIVANGSSGIQAHDGPAVLPDQGNLPALDHRLTLDLFLDDLSLCLVDKDFRNPPFQHVLLGIVAQHAHQRRIDIHNGSVGRGDIDTFLERFEEFRETGLVFAERGDIAPKNGNAVDIVAAHHGMRDTIEIKERPLPFQPHLDDPGPLAAFHEPGHRALQKLGSLPATLLQEITDGPADNLVERRADKIGKTAVDGANLAVKRKGEQNVVKRVDQVSIALLRPGDDGEQMIELFVAWRGLIAVFHAAHKAAQLGDLLRLLPHVSPEQGNDNDKEDGWQCLIAIGERTDGSP